MGKTKCVFDSVFKKTRYFDVENVNYDSTLKMGTCMLKSKKKCYVMIWSLREYPVELPSMPGAPYPVLCEYAVFSKKYHHLCSAEAMTGKFIYEVNSGTPPTTNPLGIPSGEYSSLARDTNRDKNYKVCLSLGNDCMEVSIKSKC